MQVIDYMIMELANIFSRYWILGGCIIIGFIFRRELCTSEVIPEFKTKKIIRIIASVIVLTLMWGILYNQEFEDNVVTTILILTIVYAFVVVAEKCNYSSTESLLLIVNGTMITTLAFQPYPHNIGYALFTIVIAGLAYKFNISFELLSDFIEIIIISFESIIASLVMNKLGWDGIIETILFVIFCETFLFMVNVGLKFLIKKICKENTDSYLFDICS